MNTYNDPAAITDTDEMHDFIRSLSRGDTFEARVTYPSGTEGRRLYEVGAQRDVGDLNGFATVKHLNLGAPNNTRRLYVTEEGISVSHDWGPSDTMVDAMAPERGDLTVATYALEADRDEEGKITTTRLVRTGENNDPDHIKRQIELAEAVEEGN